jgi:integrase
MVLVTEKRTVSDPKERTVNAGMELMKVAPAGSTGDLEGPLSAELEALDEELRETLAASVAPSTTKAYDRAWRRFVAWCDGYDLVSLPASPQTVARYLKALAETHKPATLTQHCSAIAGAHKAAGYAEPPTRSLLVHKTLTGIRRQQGIAPDAKAPLTVADLRAIVCEHLPDGLKGQRDRALLLVGFAGAFRRSELAGIDVEHLEFVAEGVVITLPSSKTDQEGAGRKVGIPFGRNTDTCPVGALVAWLAAAHIDSGPIFRAVDRGGHVGAERLANRSVALLVKHYVAALGRDPAAFSGHSLRAGHATAAALAGVEERDIMRQTGHRSTAMLRRYIRDGSLFRSNSAAALGL